MLREWNTRSNHLAIDIQGDIYYALSGGTNGSGDAFLLRRDLIKFEPISPNPPVIRMFWFVIMLLNFIFY